MSTNLIVTLFLYFKISICSFTLSLVRLWIGGLWNSMLWPFSFCISFRFL